MWIEPIKWAETVHYYPQAALAEEAHGSLRGRMSVLTRKPHLIAKYLGIAAESRCSTVMRGHVANCLQSCESRQRLHHPLYSFDEHQWARAAHAIVWRADFPAIWANYVQREGL